MICLDHACLSQVRLGGTEQVSCLIRCQASAHSLTPTAGSLPCRWGRYQWWWGSPEMPSQCPIFKSTGCRSYKCNFRLTRRTLYSGWRSRANLRHMGVLQISFLKLWRIRGWPWKLHSLKRNSVPGLAQEIRSVIMSCYSWRRLWLKKISSRWDWLLHFPEKWCSISGNIDYIQ